MNRSIRLLTHLYSLLLNLYPRSYRAEYGEELQTVFFLSVQEAAQRGWLSVTRASLRELRDLPGAILLKHWQERRKRSMATDRSSVFTSDPGSWREVVAALSPFILWGVLPTALHLLRVYAIAVAPTWSIGIINLGTLCLFLGLFLYGVIKRFPRWFLPNIGLPLAVFSVYGFFELLTGLRRSLVARTDPWVVRQIAYQGQLWIGLLVAGIFLLLITRLLPPWRTLHSRFRRDGTLLSFSLYGASLLALAFTFDDYVGEEPYEIVAMLLLAGGAWFYLRTTRPWQRLLALFGGLTLAMAVAAVGKAILYANPSWQHSGMFTPLSEAMSTVIMWGWLMLGIFTPALLGLLPYPDRTTTG